MRVGCTCSSLLANAAEWRSMRVWMRRFEVKAVRILTYRIFPRSACVRAACVPGGCAPSKYSSAPPHKAKALPPSLQDADLEYVNHELLHLHLQVIRANTVVLPLYKIRLRVASS
ncbi:hypothetical protein MRB53_041496 [Persea americana]|nr:hypothetical protein MRB53_041496 [Persea americana]